MASSSDNTLTITPTITTNTATSITNNQDEIKYDVFLSFRGEDTRRKFTAHLYTALNRSGIDAYIDNRLAGGESIETLERKITECLVSVVILSPKYADSTWCMRELVEILKCKEKMGQIVLPVFVGVEPVHVMEQTGEFGDGFKRLLEKSEEREKMEETWRKALVEIGANSSEWDSNKKSEPQIIEEIVAAIKKILDPLCANDLKDGSFVGSGRILNVESRLRLDSKEGVHSVGIFGCSGIGKTTIAQNVFCRHSDAFDGACFLENIAEKSQSEHSLQKDMITQLLGQEDSNAGLRVLLSHIERKLKRKRVLIVLDGVGTVQQSKTLLEHSKIYGPGSRIIVTSRERQVLKNGCTDIYEVERLNEREASQLFKYHAFKEDEPSGEFIYLSEMFVAYAKGLPSVLVNLGSDLYGKSIEVWESQLAKLQETHL